MNRLSSPDAAGIEAIAEILADARRVLFVTGAGISADSGLPTYRGTGGLYDGVSTEEGYAIEDALSGDMLRYKPAITWKYLAQIEATCRDAKPNRAHEVIAELEDRVPEVLVYTQNIDGLHHKAGSSDIIEIHGNLYYLSCTRCDFHTEVENYAALVIPPQCPTCSALLRPDVVLFGEALPHPAIRKLERELDQGFDLVFSIGTSSIFPYIMEPVIWARRCGIPTVEINPGQTSLSEIVEHRIPLGAAAAMSILADKLSGTKI